MNNEYNIIIQTRQFLNILRHTNEILIYELKMIEI